MNIYFEKKPRGIQILTAIGSLLIVCLIVASGIDAFLLNWSKTTLIYSIGVLIGALVWYLLWILRIDNKEKFSLLSGSEDDNSIDPKSDKDLVFEFCSECEQENYYFFTKHNDEPRIVICWNCGKNISFVWCEKCGLGGDFVPKVSEKPTSWECPNCHDTYPIPAEIFENSIASMAEKNIPIHANLSRLKSQKAFEKEQAAVGIWLLASLALSITLFLPISSAFTRLFENVLMIAVDEGLGIIFAFILSLPLWYGLCFYPLLLRDKMKRSQTESV